MNTDNPGPKSTVPLLPMVAFPVLNGRPVVPPLLMDTTMLLELVAVPTPNEMVMEPSEAVLPTVPLQSDRSLAFSNESSEYHIFVVNHNPSLQDRVTAS